MIDKTPFEVWYGYRPTVAYLKTFGSKAIVLDKTSSKKFRSKGIECLMIGYSDESKAYRLYNPKNRKVIVGRNVIFFEDQPSKQNSCDIKICNEDNNALLVDDDVKPDRNDDENISSKSVRDETSEDTNESAHQGAKVDNHIRFGPGRPRIVRN